MKKLFSAVICVLLAASAACFAADREHTLKVYNWADYIDEDLLEEFEQWYEEQTGEPVEITMWCALRNISSSACSAPTCCCR